jgi:hypothetical protein
MPSPIASPAPPELDRARELRENAFAAKRAWHAEQVGRSPEEKIETLLRMQREILPILRARRPLSPHERPWPIRP